MPNLPAQMLITNLKNPLPPPGAVYCTISKASSVREERYAHFHHPYAVTGSSNVDYFFHLSLPFFPFSPLIFALKKPHPKTGLFISRNS
jgi:hypothetical protein